MGLEQQGQLVGYILIGLRFIGIIVWGIQKMGKKK